MVVVCPPGFMRSPLTCILSCMLSSVVVVVVITVVLIVVSVVPVAVTMPGLGSLVLRMSIAMIVLLTVVRMLVLSDRRAGVLTPVVSLRMSPVPVPVSGVRRWWWVALVHVLLSIPVVVLSVLCSVGVTTRILPGMTSGVASGIHDAPK